MSAIEHINPGRGLTHCRGLMALGWLLLAACPLTLAEDSRVVRYPTLSEDYGQHHNAYQLELLALALDKAGQDHRLQAVAFPEFREVRSELSLAKGLYDVHWLHTSEQREARLRPVRIPLYKGLIGWRLLLINGEDRERFARELDLAQLRELRTVQGHDWPDATILQNAGFNVTRSASWEGMFRMLSVGRVDYFPRSIVEVWRELDSVDDMGLVLEEQVVLVYPSAYYFFVARENEALASAIELGLNRALADGSFDRLFGQYHGELIKRAELSRRTRLHIDNPLLPRETPLDRPELWFRPPAQEAGLTQE